MKVLVVLAHPNMGQSRINKTLLTELAKQNDVTIHDLYSAYPDEQIDVQKEQELLSAHDRIILQFPFFWYSSPHLLKKWQDTVLGYGWAFGPGGDKLKGKELVLAVSTGGAADAYVAGGHNQYSMSELLKPFQSVSNMIGTKFLIPFVVHDARNITDETLHTKAKEFVQYALSANTRGH